jgi:hypothetical protein
MGDRVGPSCNQAQLGSMTAGSASAVIGRACT